MGVLKALRVPVVVLALLWVTLYLPFAATVYTPQWYAFHCSWSSECRFAEHFDAAEASGELAAYLRHQGEAGAWPAGEREQVAVVRDGLDSLFAVTLGALLLLLLIRLESAGDRRSIQRGRHPRAGGRHGPVLPDLLGRRPAASAGRAHGGPRGQCCRAADVGNAVRLQSAVCSAARFPDQPRAGVAGAPPAAIHLSLTRPGVRDGAADVWRPGQDSNLRPFP